MRLSVVIPTRNASELLDRCLLKFYPVHEVLQEIIIVDCCSEDGIEMVLEKHAALPILHLRGRDSGIYDAFNKGVLAAGAPLVFFLGADDLVFNDLFNAAKNFDVGKFDILVGKIRIGSSVESWRPRLAGVHLLKRNIPHQGMIIKRQLLLDRPYSLKYPLLSDYAWNIENFWSSGVRYKYSPLIFCDWGQDGLSNTRADLMFKQDKSNLIEKSAPWVIRASYSVYKLINRLICGSKI